MGAAPISASGVLTPSGEPASPWNLAGLSAETPDCNLQSPRFVLGQLFLFACVLATLSIAGILFVLFGPVPVKRSVTMVPRMSIPVQLAPMPSLSSQLAPADPLFAPQPVFTAPQPFEPAPAVAVAVAPPAPVAVRKPMGAKVQPLPRKRAAKGTASPFAPVVRSGQRQVREEDAVTNPVPLFDSEEMTRVDDV